MARDPPRHLKLLSLSLLASSIPIILNLLVYKNIIKCRVLTDPTSCSNYTPSKDFWGHFTCGEVLRPQVYEYCIFLFSFQSPLLPSSSALGLSSRDFSTTAFPTILLQWLLASSPPPRSTRLIFSHSLINFTHLKKKSCKKITGTSQPRPFVTFVSLYPKMTAIFPL